ncbi:AMP-binding protein, partial [Rhodococcus sp. NPDC058514]|uniref:AMP-binding protein n=1 Tax=Rhodococcus sp. NPDC058514 TaxID=3346532 RepID=UPI00365688AF
TRGEFPIGIGACALAGATMVGLNSTRRGPDLARDIRHTDCQLVITEDRYAEELRALDHGLGAGRCIDVDAPEHDSVIAPYRGASIPDVEVTPQDVAMLILTSGSTSAPKACVCTHGRIVSMVDLVTGFAGHGPDTVSLVSMPWFHAGAINQGWLPALACGSATVVARFSVSRFVSTVRRYGVTHFNYVGKPLAYLLTAPESPDDSDTTLRIVMGNEAANDDIDRFAARFGCQVNDGYGSTEGGVGIYRTVDMPRGCLGVAASETMRVYDPATVTECVRAVFDENGSLLNANEAIGEMVNTAGAASFEGYWKNPEADAKRVRHGILWTGDLAYRDEQGYFWFAGRDDDWLRVDGENIASAQIEELVYRHPDVVLAGVYAVPDAVVGDRAMVAVQLRDGVDPADFDAAAFDEFLSGQPDFSPKWAPGFVRVCQVPTTATSKVLRRQLRQDRWRVSDPVWWRPERNDDLRPMTDADAAAYEQLCGQEALRRV